MQIGKSLKQVTAKYNEIGDFYLPLNAFVIYFACKWYIENHNGIPWSPWDHMQWVGNLNEIYRKNFSNFGECHILNIYTNQKIKQPGMMTWENWSSGCLNLALQTKRVEV